VPHAADLLADQRPAAVIADRGYDSDAFRAEVAGRGAEAVIPPLQCRTVAIP
jgi:transposase